MVAYSFVTAYPRVVSAGREVRVDAELTREKLSFQQS